MFEGHIGVKTECVETKRTHNFRVALSYLEHRGGQGWFVLHVDPGVRVKGLLSPDDFLQMLGFEKYDLTCPHLYLPCYFKPVYRVPSKSVGMHVGVRELNRFVESIHELYERACVFTTLAGQHADFIRWGRELWKGPQVLEIEGEEPGWLAESRIEGHQEALDALRKAEANRRHFQTVEYCLWGTGDDLVDSVQYVLTELGLKAVKTKPGTTVDIVLDYLPKDVELGIEVTGIADKIDKSSKKITQALAYVQECEKNCKAVILANTHKDAPMAERTELQHFTDPAERLIGGMGVVALTTVDLCRIWEDVTYGDANIDSIMADICDHEGGVYRYPA